MDKMALANRFDGYSRIFASDHPIGIDLKAMADTLRKMPEEKFAKIVDAGYTEDKEAMGLMTQAPSISQPGAGRSSITPGGQPPASAYHEELPLKPGKAKMAPDVMSAIQQVFKPSPDQIKKLEALVKSDSTAEVEAVAQPAAPVPAAQPATDPWSKLAADHIAQNLVRDVLGMNKSVCCDTGRHITKEQTMDGHKAPETKGVVNRQEDTGRALTPEQIPDIGEKLNSDMYKKSKGPVKKASTTEETPDAKAAEPQEVNEKDAKEVDPKETAKKVKEMEDDKKKAEAKAKSRPEKEEVEANVLTAEGIEFDNVMQDNIDMESPEIKKLSSLFE
jgi:hypothetical protein